MISEPQFQISFNPPEAIYRAGDFVDGQVQIYLAQALPVLRVEISLLWYTMGKGNEDQRVIALLTPLRSKILNAPEARLPFRVQLPATPVSYDGKLLKIHWAVRARIVIDRERNLGAEARFTVVPA